MPPLRCHRRELALLLLAGPLSLRAADALRIAIDANQQSGGSRGARAVLERAYGQLGLSLQFVALPMRRAEALSSAGELDGETLRAAEYGTLYPQLLRVPVVLQQMELRAFNRSGAAIESWTDLAGQRVAYQRGVLRVETELQQRLPQIAGLRSSAARDHEEALRLLELGMVDSVLLTLPRHLPAGLREQLRGLQAGSQALLRIPLYHYLHQRHAALLPRISQALEQLERSGEAERLRREAVAGAAPP